ncbi:MAG: hypothetical protein Q9168_002678 [Polycauliona sp. 1 TL-2023]
MENLYISHPVTGASQPTGNSSEQGVLTLAPSDRGPLADMVKTNVSESAAGASEPGTDSSQHGAFALASAMTLLQFGLPEWRRYNEDLTNEYESVLAERNMWKERAERYEKDKFELEALLHAPQHQSAPTSEYDTPHSVQHGPGSIAAEVSILANSNETTGIAISEPEVGATKPTHTAVEDLRASDARALPSHVNGARAQRDDRLFNLSELLQELPSNNSMTSPASDEQLSDHHELEPNPANLPNPPAESNTGGPERLFSSEGSAGGTRVPLVGVPGSSGRPQTHMPSANQSTAWLGSMTTQSSQPQKRNASQAGFVPAWRGRSLGVHHSSELEEASRRLRGNATPMGPIHSTPSSTSRAAPMSLSPPQPVRGSSLNPIDIGDDAEE